MQGTVPSNHPGPSSNQVALNRWCGGVEDPSILAQDYHVRVKFAPQCLNPKNERAETCWKLRKCNVVQLQTPGCDSACVHCLCALYLESTSPAGGRLQLQQPGHGLSGCVASGSGDAWVVFGRLGFLRLVFVWLRYTNLETDLTLKDSN